MGSETLSFRHVCFSYPGNPKPVLEDLSFSAERGWTDWWTTLSHGERKRAQLATAL